MFMHAYAQNKFSIVLTKLKNKNKINHYFVINNI